ncbi:DUF2975 domain-containing protein [Clostridium senegalense]|uniref:DUF2975 domain-containing protein n=1 Tax=Clostridium senegalense TaxID=1465809 RepID=UPI00028A400D|nr:DUF2975 domain-containing protein [Clostridium senegalense]
MKEIKSQKYVLFILYIICFSMSLITIGCIVLTFLNLHDILSIDDAICVILSILQISDYTFLSYTLIKIVKCDIYTIFSVRNSNNFKRLGYGMIFLSIIEGISNLFRESNFEIFAFEGMSLKPPSVIFLIIGLTNIYLSHAFKEGKRIKEENDLTI